MLGNGIFPGDMDTYSKNRNGFTVLNSALWISDVFKKYFLAKKLEDVGEMLCSKRISHVDEKLYLPR